MPRSSWRKFVSKSKTSPETRSDEAGGLLIVLAGPSGSGKSTILREVFARDPRLAFSVSCTTRQPRAGEVDGKDYYFIDNDQFKDLVEQDAFLEWAEVHTRRYGTRRSEITRLFGEGKDVVFDIDTVGAFNIQRQHPEAILVFILPPSMEVLEQRLRGRQTETEEMIQVRLNNARNEISQAHKFDYLVLNDSVEAASQALSAIILGERHRASRLPSLPEQLLSGESA